MPVPVTISNGQAAAGPVAAYGFEETSIAEVTDSSPYANNGLLEGGTARSTAGRFGNALQFDGKNNLMTVADAPSLDLTTAITLGAWVNPAALGTTWRTAVLKEGPGSLRYALSANNAATRPSGHVFTEADQRVEGPGALPVNQWSHLATTYDGVSQSST